MLTRLQLGPPGEDVCCASELTPPPVPCAPTTPKRDRGLRWELTSRGGPNIAAVVVPQLKKSQRYDNLRGAPYRITSRYAETCTRYLDPIRDTI